MVDEQPDAMSALARFLVGETTTRETLQQIADLAAHAVPSAHLTGITMLVNDKVTTAAYSDETVVEIDQAQYDAGAGPCLDAFRNGAIYEIPSTAEDCVWPSFSGAALDRGIHSTLSLPLRTTTHRLGALNLYSRSERSFAGPARSSAETFAEQAAVVLANAQAYEAAKTLSEQLEAAMTSRATIEQAKGILMARTPMSPDEAFDLLRKASQRENRKLRDIADEIVRRHTPQT